MARQSGVTTLQNAATATGNGTALQVAGYRQVLFQRTDGATATVTWEGTVDGATWVAVAVADLNSTTRARATTATGAGLFLLDDSAGLQAVRARVSAYTSGSVTVVASASD